VAAAGVEVGADAGVVASPWGGAGAGGGITGTAEHRVASNAGLSVVSGVPDVVAADAGVGAVVAAGSARAAAAGLGLTSPLQVR
jgi:hypothetical protein